MQTDKVRQKKRQTILGPAKLDAKESCKCNIRAKISKPGKSCGKEKKLLDIDSQVLYK